MKPWRRLDSLVPWAKLAGWVTLSLNKWNEHRTLGELADSDSSYVSAGPQEVLITYKRDAWSCGRSSPDCPVCVGRWLCLQLFSGACKWPGLWSQETDAIFCSSLACWLIHVSRFRTFEFARRTCFHCEPASQRWKCVEKNSINKTLWIDSSLKLALLCSTETYRSNSIFKNYYYSGTENSVFCRMSLAAHSLPFTVPEFSQRWQLVSCFFKALSLFKF